MNKTLAEFVRMSKAVGKDRSLVLGGFGNTSVKTPDGKYMYIKASGTALKDMTMQKGWRRLKVDLVLAMLKDKLLAGMNVYERERKVAKGLLSACDDKVRARIKPSIESGFHSMLNRYVIHLHPVAVLGYACAKNGEAELERLLRKEKLPPLWVPYANPGYMLAKRIEKLTCNYKSRYGRGPGIIFLQNHGLLVTANSSNTAVRLVHKAVNLCNSKFRQPKMAEIKSVNEQIIAKAAFTIREAFFKAAGKHVTVRHFIDESIANFMARKDASKLCLLSAITPDELIYAHGPAIWLDRWSRQEIFHKLERQIANGGKPPFVFLIKPLGLFIAGRKKQVQLTKDVVSASLAIRSFASRLGGIRPLNKRQRAFIINVAGG